MQKETIDSQAQEARTCAKHNSISTREAQYRASSRRCAVKQDTLTSRHERITSAGVIGRAAISAENTAEFQLRFSLRWHIATAKSDNACRCIRSKRAIQQYLQDSFQNLFDKSHFRGAGGLWRARCSISLSKTANKKEPRAWQLPSSTKDIRIVVAVRYAYRTSTEQHQAI